MKFRSEAQISFVREAQRLNKQIDLNDIYDLFDLIQAPQTLQSFFIHIAHLPDIFAATSDIAAISGLNDPRYRQAEKTSTALRLLLPDLQKNQKLRLLRSPVPTPRYGPCTGILETHPLYSFLAESVPQKVYKHRFIVLQAQVLVAMERMGELEPGIKETLLTPFRCLRNLNHINNWKLLEPLPVTAISTTAYAVLVQATFSQTVFQQIEHVFQTAEQAISRNHKAETSPTEKKAVRPPEQDDDAVTAETYLADILPSTSLNTMEAEEYRIHGGLPEELGAGVDYEPVLAPDTYHGPTLRQLAFQAKQASNRRALNNQFCAMAWNQANLFDIKVLLEFFDGTQVPQIDYAPLTRDEVVALLGLIFFTCNTYMRMVTLPLYLNSVPHRNSPEGIYLASQETILVRLSSPGPALTGKPSPDGAIPVDSYSHIPLPEFFTSFLDGVLGDDTSRKYLLRNFDPKNATDSIKEIHSLLKRILGELNRSNGSRLSLGRISSYLLFRVAEVRKSDLPSAMLFFGRNDNIVRTRLHYTVASSRHLETVYRQCCNDLFDNLNRDGKFSLDKTVNFDHHLGTPFCPKQATVRNIARDLRKAVHGAARSSLAHRHNLFALYTAMLIAYGTGFRAVHDPSFSEIEIDYDYGLGVVSDKGDVPYRSRFVYLAPVVLEQIDHYRRHVQVIYSHFGVTNPSLFDMAKGLEFEGLPLNLFWFWDELKPIELLTPGVTKQILQKNYRYTMPINSGRHYLKFRLLNAGCSPELIEAQLGHWENGQEPWGKYSNLDPLDFCRELARVLPRILCDDGWQALKGLG